MDTVYTKFDEGVRNNLGFSTASNYYKVLHPLAIKACLFEPNNLSGTGINLYKKGNWYIPSTDELELLIWYRIRSTATPTTSDTEAYWNSNKYSEGNSIFSDKSNYFTSFLESTMLASDVSTSNKNFVYGKLNYYSGPDSVTRYGWFYNYVADQYWSGDYHKDCCRDVKYSIAPCCTITVSKSS